MSKAQKNEKFEVMLGKLETLVEKIEAGEISLEDSLKAYEEGMGLVTACETYLNDAQKRIKVLLKDRDGVLQEKDFETPNINLQDE
jgi:exodeoxyribonuclease VII small subunit